MRGFDACASFKPRFSHCKWARRPRNQLDDDGVDERRDVQCSQTGAAVRHRPAQQHPSAPEQMHEQNGFCENRCSKNGQVPHFAGYRLQILRQDDARRRF